MLVAGPSTDWWRRVWGKNKNICRRMWGRGRGRAGGGLGIYLMSQKDYVSPLRMGR